MCGIFGAIARSNVNKAKIHKLAKFSGQRGMDSSGLIFIDNKQYKIVRADFRIKRLLKKVRPFSSQVILGHSRLITNGLSDNQPVISPGVCAIHNGIIVNEKEAWGKISTKRELQIDSELIVAITKEYLVDNKSLIDLPNKIFSICKGVIACAIVVPSLGKIILFSNNGSLYTGEADGTLYFASERYSLEQLNCCDIQQVKDDIRLIDIPVSDLDFIVNDTKLRTENLIPEFCNNLSEESLLEYKEVDLKRCTKCILPETMPFIYFDHNGVCNYCHNYKPRNQPRPKEELIKLVEPYRRAQGADCIVPFSGGRDSCYGLHLIIKELEMKPITYTYDWGMITDLGRRNVSQMCGDLGIENIIIAADISKKRKNIAKNIKAWLKSPHLGMMAMLTAGDKHFFRYVETVKKQTGIKLNLWGVNPLEVTHFKTGFLGVKPDFEEKKVYSHGVLKQLKYHKHRFEAMMQSPSYFNSSLWDTLSGEYYRSFTAKKDYYHIFDYWRWDEDLVESILDNYGWERAIDTSTSWRIGDGTAGFYNYVYYTVAGFTEHDTFRSNQVREGDLTRERALELTKDENKPRYQNIRWYLDTLGMDYYDVIKLINSIPKLPRFIQ